MRTIVISSLLVSVLGCAAQQRGRGLRPPAAYASATLPSQLTDKSYSWQRGRFDALPLDHPQRPEFLTRLRDYLLERAQRELSQKKPMIAAQTLLRVASLYDPGRVHRDPPKDEGLFKLAERVVRAFSPRGDVDRVVPALSIQIGLRPNQKRLQERMLEVLAWVDRSSQALHGRAVEAKRAISLLERAVMVWPSRFVVETLYNLYLRRATTLAEFAGGRSFRRNRALTFAALQWTGYNVVRMYVWVDELKQAVLRLPATSTSRRDDVLRTLIQRAAADKPTLAALIQLATLFERRDPLVALRVCLRAADLFRKNDQAHSCVGRLAAKVGKTALAVRGHRAAYELAPASQRYAEQLARQYQNQLFQLIEQEQLGAAQEGVDRIEAFYSRAQQRLGKGLDPPLSKVRFALGFGQYNAGRIADANASLQKSLQAAISPEALLQLATIEHKAGRQDTALKQLAQAEALDLPPTQKLYWRARIEHLRAAVLERTGQAESSQAAHGRSLDLWHEWLSLDVPPDALAEGQLRLAADLYALGRTVDALDALDQALDAAPARKESYADVIAMLATRGHLPEAQDVLHRALGRPEVTEYLKTYCSFWVIGLARRAKHPPDPLAVRYLEQLSGDAWYHKLAKFVLRKTTFEQLLSQTESAGQRAEAYFYQADQLLAAGQAKQARELWAKVRATGMMAFFEYDMASHNLRHGAAKVATQPIDRRADPSKGNGRATKRRSGDK